MAFRNKLPDSLELLLDTMCNTFGGVMFIAIALIVISSLAAKVADLTDPTQNDLRKIETVERHITELQQEIAALEAERQTIAPRFPAADPELEKLQAELRNLEESATRRRRELAELEAANRATARELKLKQHEQEAETRKLATESMQNQKQREELQTELLQLEKENKRLAEAIAKRRPRKLTFAHADATELAPYWILMRDDSIFRIGPMNEREYPIEDVTQTTAGNGRFFAYTPRSGLRLGEKPTTELEYLFREIDPKRYFIDVVLSPESFESFIALKEFLRQRSYQVNWHFTHNGLAFLHTTSTPDYQASK